MAVRPPQLLARSDTYYLNSVNGPGPLAGIAICVCVAFALAFFSCCALHRRRRRRQADDAKLERERRWNEAELRREREMAGAIADDNARRQATTLDGHEDGNAMVETPGDYEMPPPPYEGPAVPPRIFSPGAGR